MTTIKELNEFTNKMIALGYGDSKISQGYDCNYVATSINIKDVYVSKDNDIYLAEGDGYDNYPERYEFKRIKV